MWDHRDVAVNRPGLDDLVARLPTAPIAAAGLIAGFAVAVSTGSRPLGGAVMAILGLACIAVWVRRDGRRTAAMLAAGGLFAFACSHVLGLVIGAWPSVLVVSAATAVACRRLSDSARSGRPGSALRGELNVTLTD